MRFITGIFERLQSHPKRVVFPEGQDSRVIQAARQFFTLKLGIPILLGSRKQIRETADKLSIALEGVRIIDPTQSDDLETFARRFELLRRGYGLDLDGAREAMYQPNYYASMMLAMHQADAMVSGAVDSSSVVLHPLLQIIHPAEGTQTVCGSQIIELGDADNAKIGSDGVLFLADCSIQQDPTIEQLADIAVATARLALQITSEPPRVALLSLTTHESAVAQGITSKEYAAAMLAASRAEKEGIKAFFDGELQADAALISEIAQRKLGSGELGPVAGKANVLIFPNLEAADISSRLVQHLAKTNIYGDILLGIDRPVAVLSRAATAHDILGVAAILGEQCNRYRRMYPGVGIRIPGE